MDDNLWKIFMIHIAEKGLILMHKNLQICKKNTTDNPMRNVQKKLCRHFTEKEI